MGIINEIWIAPAATELESRLQILTNEIHTNYINTDGSIGMQSNLNMDENKITNISTDYPPSSQAQAVSWSQVLKFVRIATKDLFRKVGGKITGDVNMDGNKILNLPTDYPPSSQAQAVSWSQVLKFVRIATKDLFRKVGGKITGDVNMDGNKILNLSTYYPPSDRAQALSWSQIAQFLRRSTTNLANKTGDTFSGNINMDNNKIINIPDPVNDGDVVNKKTVDLTLNIGMFLGARALIGVPILNDLVFILVPDLSLMRVDELEKVIEVTDPINDLHFIQNEGIKRPTLRFDLATKHHYFEFNGTNNNLVLQNYQIDRLGGWGAYTTTLFLLVKTYNKAAQSQFRWGGDTERFNAHIPHSNGVIFLDYGNYSSYRLEIHNQQNILGNLELWTMRISENDKEVFRGTSSIIPIYKQVRGFAELPQDSKNDFYIGSGINSNFCRMDLFSLLIYSRALPIVELKGMFWYFKNKYNV